MNRFLLSTSALLFASCPTTPEPTPPPMRVLGLEQLKEFVVEELELTPPSYPRADLRVGTVLDHPIRQRFVGFRDQAFPLATFPKLTDRETLEELRDDESDASVDRALMLEKWRGTAVRGSGGSLAALLSSQRGSEGLRLELDRAGVAYYDVEFGNAFVEVLSVGSIHEHWERIPKFFRQELEEGACIIVESLAVESLSIRFFDSSEQSRVLSAGEASKLLGIDAQRVKQDALSGALTVGGTVRIGFKTIPGRQLAEKAKRSNGPDAEGEPAPELRKGETLADVLQAVEDDGLSTWRSLYEGRALPGDGWRLTVVANPERIATIGNDDPWVVLVSSSEAIALLQSNGDLGHLRRGDAIRADGVLLDIAEQGARSDSPRSNIKPEQLARDRYLMRRSPETKGKWVLTIDGSALVPTPPQES